VALAVSHPAADLRRTLDLEAFLVWAIRDQMADRTDTALHPAEAVAHYGVLYGLPIGAGVYETGISADGCAAIANRNEVGTDIDGGGAIRGLPPRVHPDAELVADIIEGLGARQRRLVLHHARHADRPEWLHLVQPLVAVKRPSDAKGRYRHVVAELGWEATPKQSEIAQRYFARGISLFDRLGRRRIVEEERGFQFRVLGDGSRQVLVKWCPVEPAHSKADIREANADYMAWHEALWTIFYSLKRARRLRGHVVSGFAAPALPWELNP